MPKPTDDPGANVRSTADGSTTDTQNTPEAAHVTSAAGRGSDEKLEEINADCSLAPIEHEDEVVGAVYWDEQNNASWLAPMMHEDETDPGEFLIMFRPGHSMDKHFEHIGRDLSGPPYRASGDEWGYAISQLFDKELLLKIRRDPGLDRVCPGVPVYDDADDEVEDVDWDEAIHGSGGT